MSVEAVGTLLETKDAWRLIHVEDGTEKVPTLRVVLEVDIEDLDDEPIGWLHRNKGQTMSLTLGRTSRPRASQAKPAQVVGQTAIDVSIDAATGEILEEAPVDEEPDDTPDDTTADVESARAEFVRYQDDAGNVYGVAELDGKFTVQMRPFGTKSDTSELVAEIEPQESAEDAQTALDLMAQEKDWFALPPGGNGSAQPEPAEVGESWIGRTVCRRDAGRTHYIVTGETPSHIMIGKRGDLSFDEVRVTRKDFKRYYVEVSPLPEEQQQPAASTPTATQTEPALAD